MALLKQGWLLVISNINDFIKKNLPKFKLKFSRPSNLQNKQPSLDLNFSVLSEFLSSISMASDEGLKNGNES